MEGETASILKEVFTERNISVLSISSFITWTAEMPLYLWWSLYLQESGAGNITVGVIAAVQTLLQTLCQLPGGMLADKFGRKRVIVYAAGVRAINSVICIIIRTWQQFVPVIIINAMATGIIMNAMTAVIAESLPSRRRGAAFGANRLITSTPTLFMPILTGIYMDQVGTLAAMKNFFYVYFIGSTVAFVIRAKFLKETLQSDVDKEPTDVRKDLISLFNLRGSILIMLVVAIISTFFFRMTEPFMVIYGVTIIGLSKKQWGALHTIPGLISSLLSLPGGLLSDRVGRRPLIFLARLFYPFNQLGLILFQSFTQILSIYLLVGITGGLGGGGARMGVWGGPAWQALIADLVPAKDRGKVLGFIATVSGILSMPASIIGGYLWTGFSPDSLFLSAFILGMVAAFIFYLFVKEPKVKEK